MAPHGAIPRSATTIQQYALNPRRLSSLYRTVALGTPAGAGPSHPGPSHGRRDRIAMAPGDQGSSISRPRFLFLLLVGAVIALALEGALMAFNKSGYLPYILLATLAVLLLTLLCWLDLSCVVFKRP